MQVALIALTGAILGALANFSVGSSQIDIGRTRLAADLAEQAASPEEKAETSIALAASLGDRSVPVLFALMEDRMERIESDLRQHGYFWPMPEDVLSKRCTQDPLFSETPHTGNRDLRIWRAASQALRAIGEESLNFLSSSVSSTFADRRRKFFLRVLLELRPNLRNHSPLRTFLEQVLTDPKATANERGNALLLLDRGGVGTIRVPNNVPIELECRELRGAHLVGYEINLGSQSGLLNLKRTSFGEGTEIYKLRFPEVLFYETDFANGTRITDSEFGGARLGSESQRGAGNRSASLDNAYLQHVTFRDINLESLWVHAATLDGVTFRSCQLYGTNFDEATLIDVRLEDCDASQISLQQVKIQRLAICKTTLPHLQFATARQDGNDKKWRGRQGIETCPGTELPHELGGPLSRFGQSSAGMKSP